MPKGYVHNYSGLKFHLSNRKCITYMCNRNIKCTIQFFSSTGCHHTVEEMYKLAGNLKEYVLYWCWFVIKTLVIHHIMPTFSSCCRASFLLTFQKTDHQVAILNHFLYPSSTFALLNQLAYLGVSIEMICQSLWACKWTARPGQAQLYWFPLFSQLNVSLKNWWWHGNQLEEPMVGPQEKMQSCKVPE